MIVDLDATLVTAHSDKQGAEPTQKKTFGFAPMCAFVDHGVHGTGETLAIDLRPGKASPWNSADHVATLEAALLQLPTEKRSQVLVRADTGAAAKAFLHHITDTGLEYSIGFPAMGPVKAAVEAIPEQGWRAAVDSDGEDRDGAHVAELTAWMPTRPTDPLGGTVRAAGVAGRDAGHRPPGMSPSRRTAAVDRPQRMAHHLFRHQHQGNRLDRGHARGPTPATRPLREPRPRPERHQTADPAPPPLAQTGSGSRSSRSPPTCAPVCRPSPSTSTSPPGGGEPNRLRFRVLTVAGRIIRTGRRRRLRLPLNAPWNRLIDAWWTSLRTA